MAKTKYEYGDRCIIIDLSNVRWEEGYVIKIQLFGQTIINLDEYEYSRYFSRSNNTHDLYFIREVSEQPCGIGLYQLFAHRSRPVAGASAGLSYFFFVGPHPPRWYADFLFHHRAHPKWADRLEDESIAALTTGYLMIDFAVGLLLWFLLRRRFLGSSLWILGSTAGIGFSFWFILATDLINRSGIISFIVGVLIYTITTGLILTRLLTQNALSEMNRSIPPDLSAE